MMAQNPQNSNEAQKIMMVMMAILLLLFIAAGVYYYKKKQDNTVSVEIGDAKISATVEE